MSADEGKKYIVSECKLDEPQLLEKRRNFISICRIICVDLRIEWRDCKMFAR